MKGNKDCFAYCDGGTCSALKTLDCAKKDGCKFYKTKNDVEQERTHSKLRISKMLTSGQVR